MTQIVEEQYRILDECKADGKRDLKGQDLKRWIELENEWFGLNAKRKPLFRQLPIMEGNTEHRVGATIYDQRSIHQLADEAATYRFNPTGTDIRDSFNRFLQRGMHVLSGEEVRALQAEVDSAGGFLVTPVQVVAQLIKDLDNFLQIRQFATKFTLDRAESFRAPELGTDFGDPEWTSELRTGSEDSDLDFTARDFYPHPLARRLKVSNKLLRLSVLDPDQIVRERMIYKIGVVLENAYLNGTGSNQPLGIFTDSSMGVDSSRDVTSGVTTSIKADDIMACVGQLKAQYRTNCRWIMSRTVEERIRTLKSGEGQYLWAPGLESGIPNRLAGFPIILSEYAPSTWSSGEYILALADLRQYWIVDSLQTEIRRLDELYQETAQTGFICRFEGDGAPVTAEGFVRLKLA
jgi:HK97 family phage major capsid protein